VTNSISNQYSSTIVIVGAGQLGSRYLQGLALSERSLDIYVQDISDQSLRTSKNLWDQAIDADSIKRHKVTLLSSLENFPQQIDIAIVSTNANVRPQVVKQIVKNCNVRYWILEKILAQSEATLDEISLLTRNSNGVWINHPFRMMNIFRIMRKNLLKDAPLIVRVSGSLWGMACNTTHYLDLVEFLTGETLTELDISQLDSHWIKSKRKGFFEVTGKITTAFSRGTTLILESRKKGPVFSVEIESQDQKWKIDDRNRIVSGVNGVLITGNIEMQSLMTKRLVDTLLTGGNCHLPKLSESLELHRFFLRSLLEHWNYSHGTNIDTLPIT